jgi:rare lipoprotein A
MYSITNKLFYFFKNSRNIFFITFLTLIQGCTSSIEVAANLGKKYLIPKEEKKRIQKPIYKIGKKYSVGGKYYYPKKDLYYNKTGIASWYGPKFHGKLTANGEIYNQYALTAAHKTLPLPSAVKVTNLKNNKSIVLRINDRGPFVNDRIIDLSSKAADILDLKREGTGLVRVQILREKSLYLEKLAKQGSFPEINDLKETELPNITIPSKVAVKIKDTKNQKIVTKKINYNLKNLNKEYKIYIKLASFSSKKNAEIMKKKVSYIDKVKIYKIYKLNKTLYQVKAGPFLSVEKVDQLHSLLLQKGMQGAKIIIE